MQTLVNTIKSLEYHLGNNKDVESTREDKHYWKAKRKTWKVSSLFVGTNTTSKRWIAIWQN